MRMEFILVTLYMGPVGQLIHVFADKEPRSDTYEQFTAPLWKQGIGSMIHCVAGDATGIILAAVITAAVGLPMWLDVIVEYAAGFAFGLLIFQALFMRRIMSRTYWENVRQTFLPEFMSMNAMMAGMAPVMSFLMMGRDMGYGANRAALLGCHGVWCRRGICSRLPRWTGPRISPRNRSHRVEPMFANTLS